MAAVDLFCGSGGFSAGLIDSGFEVVSAFDHWPAAVETYRRNIGDHAHVLDLSSVDEAVEALAGVSPDILVGGPPCQDFSTAGKRVEGERTNLTVAFGEVIRRCRPDFFLMENVPQVRLSSSYSRFSELLSRAGYRFVGVMLDASLCGVPQIRRRYFTFGWLDSSRDLGERFVHWIEERKADSRLTVKQYLASDIDIEFYYRHPRNYSRRAVFSVHEPSPTIRGVNRPVPPNYKGNHLDSAPPSTVRALTTWERSRIQTFPRDWDWGGDNRNGAVELQIGNAVPVGMAAFVASGVQHAIA